MLLNSLIECLTEAVHHEIKQIMDADSSAKEKNDKITTVIRNLMHDGKDSGLQHDKPILGSSRAVYLHKDSNDATIDGVKTKIPSVSKIAFASKLDDFRPDKPLLGELQNKAESDDELAKHAVLHKTGHDTYNYNPDGVLAPVLSKHEGHHWLEMGEAHDVSDDKIKELTKTKDFPHGLTHDHIYNAVVADHKASIGRPNAFDGVDQKIYHHPLVKNLVNFMNESHASPFDFSKSNMGVWKHPVSGKEHIVLRDYGATHALINEYAQAQKKYRRTQPLI